MLLQCMLSPPPGLVPFTEYSAVVSAVNQEGEGPPSQPPMSATTLQGGEEEPVMAPTCSCIYEL